MENHLKEFIAGNWYRRSLPHAPGRVSGLELLPAVGLGVTIRRMARDEPNLTDWFSGHVTVPAYHVFATYSLFEIGSMLHDYLR